MVSLETVQSLGYRSRDYHSGPRAFSTVGSPTAKQTVGGIKLKYFRGDDPYPTTEEFHIVKYLLEGYDVLLPMTQNEYPVTDSSAIPIVAATMAAKKRMTEGECLMEHTKLSEASANKEYS